LNFDELEGRTCLTISLTVKYVSLKCSGKGDSYVYDEVDDDPSFDKHLKH